MVLLYCIRLPACSILLDKIRRGYRRLMSRSAEACHCDVHIRVPLCSFRSGYGGSSVVRGSEDAANFSDETQHCVSVGSWIDVRELTLLAEMTDCLSPCFVAAIRLAYIEQLYHSQDPLYDFTPFAILSCLETGMSMVASNLATFRALFRRGPPDRIAMRRFKKTSPSSYPSTSTQTTTSSHVLGQEQYIKLPGQ